MDDMSEPRHARLTAARALIGDNPVLLGIAGIGFSVSFQTIAGLARAQHMPGWPVLYPILIDLGILGFIVEARKAISDGRGDLVPRVLAWALAGFTIYVNAHGSPARDWLGVALHVVAPALWVAFLEMSRWRTRRRRSAAREGIPFPRWVLAPLPTFLLYRRMVLWQEVSYARALEREQLRRRTMARLRAAHGSRWKKADRSITWNLVHGIDVEGAAEAVQRAAEAAAKAELRASSAPRTTARHPAKRKAARSTAARAPGTSGPDTDDLTAEMRALSIIVSEPGISGSELGRRLGKTPRYGRQLLAKLAPVAMAERG